MGRLLSFLEKLMFTDDCMREYKSRRMLAYYCFAGGFCFDKRFKHSFRITWTTYNLLSTLVVSTCCSCYLTDLTVRDFRTIFLGLAGFQFVWTKVFYFLLLYYYRQTYGRVINLLTQNVDASLRKQDNHVLNPTYWVIGYVVEVAIIYDILYVQDVNEFFKADSKITTKAYFMYLYPISWPFESYWSIELGIRIFQLITFVPDLIFLIMSSMLAFTAFVEMHNNFSKECLHLEEISQLTFYEMEKLHEAESQLEEIDNRLWCKYEYKRLKRAKNEERVTFCACFKEYIAQIQELRKWAIEFCYFEVW